jgi:phytoene dehydrogenase-like protein
MGGLTAALHLARLGHRVRVCEARASPGGLASGLERDGYAFDAGPYILLDRPGLEWAFAALGLRLDDAVTLDPVDPAYEVRFGEDGPIRFLASRDETAAELDRRWPGSGRPYRSFVDAMLAIHRRTRPLLVTPRPGLGALLRAGAWRDVPFLLRSLGDVLARTGLPREVQAALAIWTHVAGQPPAEAPSPMALVPALIHSVGAYCPREGVRAIPRLLADRAAAAGARLDYGLGIRAIRTTDGRVRGVETAAGEILEADAVVSNAHGVGTYLTLLDRLPEGPRAGLARLPLQSPGLCAYLRVRAEPRPPYLRFHVPAEGESCRLFVMPGAVNRDCGRDGWWPARLVAPLAHDVAGRLGPAGQRERLHRLLGESWWRDGVTAHEVLAERVPAEWGAEFGLYRDSMNPIMTARFMRAGRLPHRSPFVRGLYLAGSSTHPGQWVSFCAISGLLAAEQLHRDLA